MEVGSNGSVAARKPRRPWCRTSRLASANGLVRSRLTTLRPAFRFPLAKERINHNRYLCHTLDDNARGDLCQDCINHVVGRSVARGPTLKPPQPSLSNVKASTECLGNIAVRGTVSYIQEHGSLPRNTHHHRLGDVGVFAKPRRRAITSL